MKRLIHTGFLFILALPGCDRFNLVPEVSINFQNPTDVTETSFGISWSINPSDYVSLTFVLAGDPSFSTIVATRTFRDRSVNSTRFENLTGARTYYYRISLAREPGDIHISKTRYIEMPYRKEEVNFMTPDSVQLNGTVSYLESKPGIRPAVILMHDLDVFVNDWHDSKALKSLVSKGYICLAYSFRGHGLSAYVQDRQALLDDLELMSNDLRGAMAFISGHEKAAPDSLGLMGAGTGGSLALSGNGSPKVLTSVALSATESHVSHMFPDVPLRSVFYIAAENDLQDTSDGRVDLAAVARMLFDATEKPRRLLIVKNSDAHGTDLLDEEDVPEQIVQWFLQYMPVAP